MAQVPVRADTPNAGGLAPANLQQQNNFARAAIRQRAQDMIQQISGTTIATPGTTNNIVNVSPRLVGFLKRFYIEVSAKIVNSGTNVQSLTDYNVASLLSRITFTDLSNNVRHNSPGWHFHNVASAKRAHPYASAATTDSPVKFGSNFTTVIQAPGTIGSGGTATVNMLYEVPITYDDNNLSGGIWLGVTNATATLGLTINPTPGVTTGSDATLGIYTGTTGGTDLSISTITINTYQHYLDQLPTDQNGRVILPINDISTVYMLQDTTQQGMVVNSDFPIPYANARDFLSTFAIFDNGGTLNTGGDVNSWGIQAANFINFQKYDPTLSAAFSRNAISDDWPKGTYYWSHRHKPISTAQFGNTELVLNASTVNANAKLLIGYEMFALVNLVAQAGALAVA